MNILNKTSENKETVSMVADNINNLGNKTTLDYVSEEYQKFLKEHKGYYEKLFLISGVTCIGKTTTFKRLGLKQLNSYKTGPEWMNSHNNQVHTSNEEFLQRMKDKKFFDIYSINEKYYAYDVDDYLKLKEENGQVFGDISIESIFNKLSYTPEKIFILDYSTEALERNVKQRIEERRYDEAFRERLRTTIEREQGMLEYIKQNKENYPNVEFVKSEEELKNRLEELKAQ